MIEGLKWAPLYHLDKNELLTLVEKSTTPMFFFYTIDGFSYHMSVV